MLKGVAVPYLIIYVCFMSGCLKRSTTVKAPRLEDDGGNIYAIAKQDPHKDLYFESRVNKITSESDCNVRQQEARLVDIPIPFHADSLGFHENQLSNGVNDSLVLAYRVYMKEKDIRSFFITEMERLGWNMISNVQNIESLLVFIKPTKVCAVSIRSNEQDLNSFLIITYGNNQSGYLQE